MMVGKSAPSPRPSPQEAGEYFAANGRSETPRFLHPQQRARHQQITAAVHNASAAHRNEPEEMRLLTGRRLSNVGPLFR